MAVDPWLRAFAGGSRKALKHTLCGTEKDRLQTVPELLGVS